jgi:pyrroline-5-carboxylate reductase
MTNYNIAFIGGGNMTRAIVAGLRQSRFPAQRIFISEPLESQREILLDEFPGSVVTGDNDAVLRDATSVVLAVKPQVLPAVCKRLATSVQERKPLVISIAAGIHSRSIENWLGGNLAIVRVMPNQPAILRLGVSGMFANERANAEDIARATEILSAVGSVVIVDTEDDIDTVTAVSGTGPAYFYLLIDMLINIGVDLGLDKDAAERLAIETARGAGQLASEANETMESMIERVRSPGGTTEAAFQSLEADDVRAIFSRAVTAARDRAVDLANAAEHGKD